MSNEPKVVLLGAGNMSIAYAEVLKALDIQPMVLGRGKKSASAFHKATGINPTTGDLQEQLVGSPKDATAIVAVSAHALAEVTIQLMENGFKRILVEKPAALDINEMTTLLSAARANDAKVYVAYNRRFLSSIMETERMIAEDGGLVSIRFDFSEPSKRIGALDKHPRELATWFYGNSTHVIDLAFHLFGPPDALDARISEQGGVPWHPDSGVFVGFGRREDTATIAWHSNWVSPGRWGLEVLTRNRRIILQPLEKVRVQTHDSFAEQDVQIDDTDDQSFKPGLLKQTKAFLHGAENNRLVSLEDHAANMKFYEAIRTGTKYRK